MARGVLGQEASRIVQVGMGDIMKDNFVIVNSRKAWTISGSNFTRVKVDSGDDIIWNDEPTDSKLRVGTATFTISMILLDEIEEWMVSHGFEYELISDDAGKAKAVLAMFDLDAFLLFKLTWAGA